VLFDWRTGAMSGGETVFPLDPLVQRNEQRDHADHQHGDDRHDQEVHALARAVVIIGLVHRGYSLDILAAFGTRRLAARYKLRQLAHRDVIDGAPMRV